MKLIMQWNELGALFRRIFTKDQEGGGLRLLPILAVAFLMVGTGGATAAYFTLERAGLLDIDESKLDVIVNYKHSDNSLVFDKDGTQIGEFFSDYHVFYPYDKIPKTVIEAVISIEDRNFFQHHGVDFKAIARAVLSLVRTGSLNQGASTITQQVVRNFLLTPERKFSRKIKEAIFAMQLERRVSKERILEIYLNALFLGQGSYGFAAAAQRHFGKTLEELNPAEIALIAGLFQSPTRYNPHKNPKAAKIRQVFVLKAMVATRALPKNEFKRWKDEPLVYSSPNSMNQSVAPYFLDAVQDQAGKLLSGKYKGEGLRITTTLDLKLQRELDSVLKHSNEIYSQAARNLINVKNPNESMIEAASLVLNHRTGEVLAMVGGRDFQKSQFNRALKAKRAPGSCIKPLVYAQGLMTGMNWSDITYIAPVAVQNYRPKNYGEEFMTESTYFSAFYRSINTPVVELGSRLGIKKIIDLAYKMGVKTELKAQAGTLLGGAEMTMMDLAQIYGTIGNEGQRPEPYLIETIKDRDGTLLYQRHAPSPTRVFSPQVAYLLTAAMQAVFRYGTAAKFPEFASYSGGKTGTTDEAKDNWFCGITSDITSIVWVGTDENYAFGGNIAGNVMALPIWARMMERIKDRYPPAAFTMPTGIIKKKVNSLYGFEDPNGIEMPLLEGRGPERRESSLTTIRDTGSYRDALDW